MPFKSPEQAAYLKYNEPAVYNKWKNKYAGGGLLTKSDVTMSMKDPAGNTVSFKSPAGQSMNKMISKMIEPEHVADDIPILASEGEFMVNAPATMKYRPLLEKINNEGRQMLAMGGMTRPKRYVMGGPMVKPYTMSTGQYLPPGRAEPPKLTYATGGEIHMLSDDLSAPSGVRGGRVKAVKGSDQYRMLSSNPNYIELPVQGNPALAEFALKNTTADALHNQRIVSEDKMQGNRQDMKTINAYKFYDELMRRNPEHFYLQLQEEPIARMYAKDMLGMTDQQIQQRIYGTTNTDVASNLRKEDMMSPHGGPSNMNILNRGNAELTVGDLGQQEVVEGNQNKGFTYTYVSGTTYQVQSKEQANQLIQQGKVQRGAMFMLPNGMKGRAQ